MPEEHLTWLRAVFEKLKGTGLKLKPAIVSFFKESLTYLGHRILEDGVEMCNNKIKVI